LVLFGLNSELRHHVDDRFDQRLCLGDTFPFAAKKAIEAGFDTVAGGGFRNDVLQLTNDAVEHLAGFTEQFQPQFAVIWFHAIRAPVLICPSRISMNGRIGVEISSGRLMIWFMTIITFPPSYSTSPVVFQAKSARTVQRGDVLSRPTA